MVTGKRNSTQPGFSSFDRYGYYNHITRLPYLYICRLATGLLTSIEESYASKLGTPVVTE
jgi:hypothetical protein